MKYLYQIKNGKIYGLNKPVDRSLIAQKTEGYEYEYATEVKAANFNPSQIVYHKDLYVVPVLYFKNNDTVGRNFQEHIVISDPTFLGTVQDYNAKEPAFKQIIFHDSYKGHTYSGKSLTSRGTAFLRPLLNVGYDEGIEISFFMLRNRGVTINTADLRNYRTAVELIEKNQKIIDGLEAKYSETPKDAASILSGISKERRDWVEPLKVRTVLTPDDMI